MAVRPYTPAGHLPAYTRKDEREGHRGEGEVAKDDLELREVKEDDRYEEDECYKRRDEYAPSGKEPDGECRLESTKRVKKKKVRHDAPHEGREKTDPCEWVEERIHRGIQKSECEADLKNELHSAVLFHSTIGR